jgi:hypothetical protein
MVIVSVRNRFMVVLLVSFWPLAGLDQVEEPECAGNEAGS